MPMSRIFPAVALSTLALAAQAQHGAHGAHGMGGHHAPAASPYAGEQSREIKALSPQEQRGWLEGQGMGLARAAELNGYPGPMHVLELARDLQLTEAQAQASRSLMEQHKAQARELGARLVEAERQLDVLFRERRADEAQVARLTGAIAELQAAIRASHLQTHLRQTALLSAQQVERYGSLRGYR